MGVKWGRLADRDRDRDMDSDMTDGRDRGGIVFASTGSFSHRL